MCRILREARNGIEKFVKKQLTQKILFLLYFLVRIAQTKKLRKTLVDRRIFELNYIQICERITKVVNLF